MKRIFIVATLMAASILIFNNEAQSHPKAEQRNKCGVMKKFLARAKVNGPSCGKDVMRKPSCTGETAEAALYHQIDGQGFPKCECQLGPPTVDAAWAKAIANPTELSEYSKKSGCANYKAGGTIIKTQNEGEAVGTVENYLYASTISWDYENNAVTIAGLTGFLEINTPQFINEYSIFTIKVTKILSADQDGYATSSEVLFEAEVAYINGQLSIQGTPGGFQNSDFVNAPTTYGSRYTLNTTNKTIQLPVDILESMDLAIEFAGDVGNITAGDAEMLLNNIKLSTSLVGNSNPLLVDLLSTVSMNGTIEVRNLIGTVLLTHPNVNLSANVTNNQQMDVSALPGNGTMYIVVFRSTGGIIRTQKILKV